MLKSSFYVFDIKKILKKSLFISVILFLLLCSKSNFSIMKNTVTLFVSNVIPALFPFIFFTNVILNTGYISYIYSSPLCIVLSRILRISVYGSAAVIIGLLMGYPNSAKYVGKMVSEGKISLSEANYLMSFTNNASPVYILSSIGIGMFSNIYVGILLLFSNILSSIIISLFLLLFKRSRDFSYSSNIIQHSKGKINKIYEKKCQNIKLAKFDFDSIYLSIKDSMKTLSIIFSFMAVFSIIFNYIKKIAVYVSKILGISKYSVLDYFLGIFEKTSGIQYLNIKNIQTEKKLVIIAFFIGFSSLSIISQIFSCVYKNRISLSNLIFSKLVQGILCGVFTYVLLSVEYFKTKILDAFNLPTYFNLDSTSLNNSLFFKRISSKRLHIYYHIYNIIIYIFVYK